MSERVVHVHIRRLVIDEPLRGQAARWSDAIGPALERRLTNGHARHSGETQLPVPEATAEHIARHLGDAASRTSAAQLPNGGARP
jgi:hypothetical protein